MLHRFTLILPGQQLFSGLCDLTPTVLLISTIPTTPSFLTRKFLAETQFNTFDLSMCKPAYYYSTGHILLSTCQLRLCSVPDLLRENHQETMLGARVIRDLGQMITLSVALQ